MEKKVHWNTTCGTITLVERLFIDKSTKKTIRPFTQSASVVCRGRSLRLQKALTDFGADESFAKAALKVKEHYGVDVAISTTRLDVEKNARKIQATEKSNRFSVNLRPSECIIGQLDGSMIPIVSQTEPAKTGDKRKNKQYEWKEIRVAVGNPKGSDTSIYAAIMGSTDEAGECLARVVKQAGKRKKLKFIA